MAEFSFRQYNLFWKELSDSVLFLKIHHIVQLILYMKSNVKMI